MSEGGGGEEEQKMSSVVKCDKPDTWNSLTVVIIIKIEHKLRFIAPSCTQCISLHVC